MVKLIKPNIHHKNYMTSVSISIENGCVGKKGTSIFASSFAKLARCSEAMAKYNHAIEVYIAKTRSVSGPPDGLHQECKHRDDSSAKNNVYAGGDILTSTSHYQGFID